MLEEPTETDKLEEKKLLQFHFQMKKGARSKDKGQGYGPTLEA